MHKSEHTLLIWVLSWASALLVILYSPIFSPDLYKNRKYCDENQGVNFNKTVINQGLKDLGSLKGKVESVKGCVASLGTVRNALKSRGGQQGENQELYVTGENIKRNKRYNYRVSYIGKSNISKNTVVSLKYAANSGSVRNSGSEGNNSSYSGNNGGGNGGSGTSVSSGTSRGSQNNTISQNPGVSTAGVDLSIFNDSTRLLASNNQSQKVDGFSDPGTEDPLGEPVPIPEGWGFLFLMAALYGGYILIKNKKIKAVQVPIN